MNGLNGYHTLDVDDKRFIVMSKPGGPQGRVPFYLWLGPKFGLVKNAVAYAGPSSSVTDQSPESVTESSLTSSSDSEEDQEPGAIAKKNQRYSYGEFLKAFSPNTLPSTAPAVFETSKLVFSEEQSGGQRHFHRHTKPTKRARSSTPESKRGRTLARPIKRISHRIHRVSGDSSPSDDSSPADAPYHTPASTQISSSNEPPAQESNSQDLESQLLTSMPVVSPYKQIFTTLRVLDSSITGFVPLRLKACMTISTLFSTVIAVIAVSGHQEVQEEPIKRLMAVFLWKDDTDDYKTINIDKGTEGSFEIFLEIINEAPCWEQEGGKCGVAVKVVRT